MSAFIGEFTGTMFLILLGNGVVANVVLNQTKGHNSGWIVIAFGWAIAVFTGVFISASASGAHLNPAVSLALAVAGKMDWHLLPSYIIAQLTGAMVGQLLVWLTYKGHYDITLETSAIHATFCTAPAIRNRLQNLMTELIGTLVLVLGVLLMAAPSASLGAMDALPVSLLVLGIGLSLGGPTGYAINPARDLGPRLMHAVLPLKYKGDSDWSYSWIPIIGPLAGGVLAAVIYLLLQ